MASSSRFVSRMFPSFTAVLTWPFRHWRPIAIVVIALAIVHTVIDQMMLRKLAAQREAIRAAGSAVSFADLDLPDLSSGSNAAISYRYADAIIGRSYSAAYYDSDFVGLLIRFRDEITSACRRKDDGRYDKGPLSADELKLIGRHLAEVQPAFDVLEEARELDGCQFISYDSPEALVADPGAFMQDLALMRNLARYVSYKALWEYRRGNIDEALRWVTTGMHLANNLASEPVLIVGLFRVACMSIALQTLQDILYDSDLPATVPAEFADELAALADRSHFARVIEGERCYGAARRVHMGLHSLRIARPLWTLAEIKYNEMTLVLADAVGQNDFGRRQSAYERLREMGRNAPPKVSIFPHRVIMQNIAPAAARAVDAFDRCIAQAHLCELAIALKRFKRETGEYPPELTALTPAYIEALPENPFSGEPYKYRRDDEGFIVYSPGMHERNNRREYRVGSDVKWCAAR